MSRRAGGGERRIRFYSKLPGPKERSPHYIYSFGHKAGEGSFAALYLLSPNQANSLLSTGPRTESGKAISSLNNLRLGFRSQTVILPGEDPAEYEALLDELTEHFGNPPELTGRHSGGRCERLEIERFVREMADAEWRLRRVRESLESALTRRIETLTLDHPDASPVTLQSMAIETLGNSTGCSYGTWLRYETKFERQYDRAHRELCRLRKDAFRDRDKAADIAMREVLFGPLPQPSREKLPNAQAATRAAVVRGREMASSVQSRESTAAPTPQIARNAPCPCGSGDKFKRCCGKNAPPVLGKAA